MTEQDYNRIVSGITDQSVIDLMKQLGADRYREDEGYIVFPTICHNIDSSEASMKLYYYKNTKIFNCYTHCGTMSIFKLLKHYYETREIEYDWYNDIYNVIVNHSTIQKEGFEVKQYESLQEKFGNKVKLKELEEYNAGALDTFIKTYPPEWLADNISKKAMDKFNILYSISQNKIIIPHYDINGRLVGIRGRALNPWEVENFGKYMPVKIEETIYRHPLSLNLYGLKENVENIRKNKICYLFEAKR